MYNAAPTPHTDIRGTLSCMHVMRTTCATVSCTHVNIVLEEKIYASRVIHPAHFKLPSKILLSVTLFEGGIASDASVAAKSSLSMYAVFSFASVFPRALEADLFLGMVVSLSGFGGARRNQCAVRAGRWRTSRLLIRGCCLRRFNCRVHNLRLQTLIVQIRTWEAAFYCNPLLRLPDCTRLI